MTTNLALKAGRDIRYHTSRSGTAVGAMAYYTGAEGEPPGVWAGKGAAALGLSGAVDPDVIERLYQKRVTPTGERLMPARTRKDRDIDGMVAAWKAAHPFASAVEVAEHRSSLVSRESVSRPYFDFALGAAKSVSLLHASLVIAAGKARRAGDLDLACELQLEADQVESALLETAGELVEDLEGFAAYTRTGHMSATSGEYRDARGLTAALFLQHTNFEGDPHLHVHVTVGNFVQRADGADENYRTLDSRQFYGQRLRAAARADRRMEARMTALGWPMAMRADGNGCEVAGVGDEIIAMFSSRRVALKPEAQALHDEYVRIHGHAPSQRALWSMKQYVADRQRKGSKGNHADPAVLLAEWEQATTDSEVKALSVLHQRVRGTASGASAVLDQDAKERCARIAVAEVQKHHATFGMSELTFEVHRALPVLPDGTDSDELITEIAQMAVSGRYGTETVMATAPDIADVSPLGVRESDGGSIFRPANEERWTTPGHLDLEEAILRDAKRPVPQLVTEDQARQYAAQTDLNDQQREALVMLLTSTTGAVALTAAAGAGKTKVTGWLARAWTELTGGRVIGLTTSTSAARVMATEGVAESYNLARFLGKCKDSDKLRYPVHVGERDFLVLDEATQVSTADWAHVQQVARSSGARTAGVGDTFQLGAVGAGGMFRLVAQEVPSVELDEVLRFRQSWERDASVKLRAGDFSAVADYDRRGRFQGADSEAAFAMAVTSWLGDHLAGKLSLLLAGSNAESAELSRRAQQHLIRMGTVTEPVAQLSDGNMAGTNDLIRARLNSSYDAGGRPITNRDTLKVTGWQGQDATVVRRELDGTWSPAFTLPGSYLQENCELDYAGNTHVGQGRTVDTGHLLVSETLDRAGFYVGMTRGREGNFAHVITGDTAPAGHEPYDQATPEAVIKAVMRRDEADKSATEQIRDSMEWAGGTGHLLTMWAESVRESVTPDIDALFRQHLSEAEYRRYEAEWSKDALTSALRHRQLMGQDLAGLVAQITSGPMDGARIISSVLHGRLAQVAMPEQDAASWADRTPSSAPEVARELAEGIDSRMAELGERAVAEPQPWLLGQLGVLAPDASPVLRAEYTRRAGIGSAYREAAGITDPLQAISARPHADRPELEAMRQAAIRSLEIDVERVSEMSRGELEARVAEGRRAVAAAPEDVSGQLRRAAVAEADAKRRAAELETEGNAQEAEDSRSLAGLMGASREDLEARNGKYEAWSDATAVVRDQAGEAQQELSRRGLDEPEEAPSTVDWWQEFERDLAAVDAALGAEREAAERDGQPWPPERPVAAVEDLEAWSARLDEASDRAALAAAAVAAQRAQVHEEAELAALEASAEVEADVQAESD